MAIPADVKTNGGRSKTTETPLNGLNNGSIDSLDTIESGNYSGIGTSPSTPSSPRQTHKRPSNKDLRKKADQQAVEKNAYSNGEKLTSTAANEDYIESLKLARREQERSLNNQHSKLVSGREAGAGWARSRFVPTLSDSKAFTHVWQHSMGTSECATQTTSADTCAPITYSNNWSLRNSFLPTLRDSIDMADPTTISSTRPLFNCSHLRNSVTTLR